MVVSELAISEQKDKVIRLERENERLRSEISKQSSDMENLELKLRSLQMGYDSYAEKNKDLERKALDLQNECEEMNQKLYKTEMKLKDSLVNSQFREPQEIPSANLLHHRRTTEALGMTLSRSETKSKKRGSSMTNVRELVKRGTINERSLADIPLEVQEILQDKENLLREVDYWKKENERMEGDLVRMEEELEKLRNLEIKLEMRYKGEIEHLKSKNQSQG